MDKRGIKQLVYEVAPDIIAMRRHIHENPELSGEEVKTSAFMAEKLRSFGVEVTEHVAGTTAVLGRLQGGKPGPVIALRADMDALPMTEETGLPSSVPARRQSYRWATSARREGHRQHRSRRVPPMQSIPWHRRQVIFLQTAGK